ncbi:MAG: hypothetical protein NZ528_07145 [Caldilineales bacterium]|nr:hypothetical protein [Caldilineales bacterium]MDW8318075.1 inositol monophosphatase family protein [Anaerolineae bacterium]
MTQDHTTSLLEFAHTLAHEAGQRLMAWFGRSASVVKRDGSLVTQADVDVDHLVQTAVRRRFPHHGVISEEGAHVYGGEEFTWVVDPLDGTTNFANGLSHWGVSLALLHQGQPLVSVLDFPALGHRFAAARGQGAWFQGRRLQTPPAPDLHGNLFIALDSRAPRLLDVRLRLKPRVLGSAAYDLAAVGAGMAAASIQLTPKVWDLAGAWLVAEEAGAAVGTLLSGVEVFPLRPGVDYGIAIFPLLFAADPTAWRQVRQATRLRPAVERYLPRLTAQGWRVDLPIDT